MKPEASAPTFSDSAEQTSLHQQEHVLGLRELGKKALATAGVTLALLGVGAIEASGAFGDPVSPAIAAEAAPVSTDTPPPAATTPSTPLAPANPVTGPDTYSGLKVGVATGNWNGDGLGRHTLFMNMAAEGMSVVRLSYTPDLRELRDEVKSCYANNIEPIIALPPDVTPKDAALIAASMPNVYTFVDGNEQNSPLFSDLSVAQNVTQLAHTTAAIHKVRPDAKVLGFALASGYHPVAFLTEAAQIANQEYGGLQNIMDGLDVHFYRTLPMDLQMLHTYEQLYPGSIYIDELGWIVGDPSHPGAVSLDEQAQNEVSFVTTVSEDPRVQTALFFKFKASPSDPFDTANVSANNVMRPAYFALQLTLSEHLNTLPTPTN